MPHNQDHNFLLLLVFAVALGALYSNGAFSSPSHFASGITGFVVEPEPETFQVAIKDKKFQPIAVTILVGDTVEWTNADKAPHTITADDGRFDSRKQAPMIFQNQKFSYRFMRAGTYPYSCQIHKSMKGVVVVRDQSKAVESKEAPQEAAPAKQPVKKVAASKPAKKLAKTTAVSLKPAVAKPKTAQKPKITTLKSKGALCTANAECTTLRCGFAKDKKKRCLGAVK